jgi:hypothetical protein
MTRLFELTLKRFYWNVGNVGDGEGHSNKLSIKLIADWRSWYIGGSWAYDGPNHLFVFVMLLPIGVQFHWARSWGGRYK